MGFVLLFCGQCNPHSSPASAEAAGFINPVLTELRETEKLRTLPQDSQRLWQTGANADQPLAMKIKIRNKILFVTQLIRKKKEKKLKKRVKNVAVEMLTINQ